MRSSKFQFQNLALGTFNLALRVPTRLGTSGRRPVLGL